MPEYVPAFQKKKYIKRNNVDPRTYVVIGDTETALSALETLRTNFSGQIISIPTSAYGAFENQDVFNRKFSPISKSEAYIVESDFLDRANIEVMRGDVKSINLSKREIQVKGH